MNEDNQSGDLKVSSIGGSQTGTGGQISVDNLNSQLIGSQILAPTVSARGTIDGVVLRLDGRGGIEKLERSLNDFLLERAAYFTGSEVSLEWVGIRPNDEILEKITSLLKEKFNITVKTSGVREKRRVGVNDPVRAAQEFSDQADNRQSEERNQHGFFSSSGFTKNQSASAATFNNHARTMTPSSNVDFSKSELKVDRVAGADMFPRIRGYNQTTRPTDSSRRYETSLVENQLAGSFDTYEEEKTPFSLAWWDEADARVLYATLRSGQKIESEHTVVVIGDVNPGAEVVAGGDIIVLGHLLGLAHAGAYDETGGGRIIIALNFQPTQIRIGSLISRGGGDSRSKFSGFAAPEIAKIESGEIIVEPFQSKSQFAKKS
ncbi:MAG TPA: septum site-determining protein MinC [Oligoflexia bacterium]|nr:septum site-determining protein MinC [Oligoflexia bacterium]HMP26418.1 septum site-determining protein MinC [Oligoflexia bacterium]